MIHYNKKLRQPSCNLRSQQTKAERLLWLQLRRKQIHNCQFNRQKPLAGYIVDFYSATAKLVIELDGAHHFEVDQLAYDTERTAILEALDLKVIRFTNQQVFNEPDKTVQVISNVVLSRL